MAACQVEDVRLLVVLCESGLTVRQGGVGTVALSPKQPQRAAAQEDEEVAPHPTAGRAAFQPLVAPGNNFELAVALRRGDGLPN